MFSRSEGSYPSEFDTYVINNLKEGKKGVNEKGNRQRANQPNLRVLQATKLCGILALCEPLSSIAHTKTKPKPALAFEKTK